MSDRERLAAYRRLRREYGGQRSSGETAYAVYLGALAAAIIGFPVIRAVILELADPRLLGVIDSTSLVPALLGALGVGVALMGPTFGPANMRAFDWSVLGSGDLPFRRTLRRPVLGSIAALIALALLGAGILLGARLLGGAAEADPIVLGIAILGALSAGSVWLAAQVLGERAWPLPIVVIAVAGTLAVLPGPAATALLGVLAIGAVLALPWLRDRVAGDRVLAQAQRVEGAGATTLGGYPGLALESFRTPPGVGRRWTAVRPGPVVTVYLRRGLIGAARTPVRFTVGLITILGGGLLLGMAAGIPGALGAALAGASTLLAYLGLGPASDGLRHAAMAAVTPAIYGVGPVRTLARHALFPLAVLVVVFVSGALIGGEGVLGASLVPVVLGLRLIAATEPPMDPAVLAPIPSPYGDLSGLRVFFWLTGTATLSVIAGALAAWIPIPGGALLVGAVTTALIVAVILNRLRRDTTA